MKQRKPSWGQLFKNAVQLGPKVDEDSLVVEDVGFGAAFFHFLTIFWKVLFAFVPPSHYCGGWPAFIVALSMIGCVTFVVGEVATVFGCVIGLDASITAITLVALGTSLPDTFASVTAAQTS